VKRTRTRVKEIIAKELVDCDVTVMGWIRSLRNSKNFSFMAINDGSCQSNFQVVLDASLENYSVVSALLAGSAVSATGKLVRSNGKGQQIEMQASEVEVIGIADQNYPLQKKATSLEFLRENAHLRCRTNTFGAVFRVRNALAFATHKFFQERGFYYLNTPIITASDCEGAGELFQVTTLDLERVKNEGVDYSKDYYGKRSYLTVSGQLEAETYAMGMGQVYTFGPTFRAENSNTSRHLSEFWMVEPEVAFADLEEIASLASDYLKYLIGEALTTCPEEMEFLQKTYKEDLLTTLTHVRDSEFVKITYTEAINILSSSKKKFDYPVSFGLDLQTEHERYLTEEHFHTPVIVTDYPKEIKAFYMKQNSDGKTVRAMDILVPGIGEIIGGSQRECDLEKLTKKIESMGQNPQDYWWYLDLRRYGSAPHAGFGLGFERAVMYITGMNNIRDVVPYPRYPKSAEF